MVECPQKQTKSFFGDDGPEMLIGVGSRTYKVDGQLSKRLKYSGKNQSVLQRNENDRFLNVFELDTLSMLARKKKIEVS